MGNQRQSFLRRKNVVISFRRYGIDAMSAMALGLFASLLIGTIINTIGQNVAPGSMISEKLLEIGGYATSVTGPVMALAIGHALMAPPLVLYSLAAVGAACNALGGSGGPLAVFFIGIVACEIGKLVSKETKIDIIVTPAATIITGGVLALIFAPLFKTVCDALGVFIGWATNLQPLLMGVVVSVVVGAVLTLPISSAAICAAIGLSGSAVLAGLADGSATLEIWNGLSLAGGAATAGCCAHMLGYAVLSFPDNGIGGFVAQGIGTSMLQVPNLMKKPVLWIPPSITAAITGALSTCVFQMRNNGPAISSGMGTSGLVGPIGVISGWGNLPEGYQAGAFQWIGMVMICFILPIVITWIIGKVFRAKGILKEGDLKIDLG
ncbi:PTS sugar transporter subunit IIC [Blautia sp.]|uniref:Phosphotransferase system EIIC domain-containing protein n=1 Tax=Blautia glucerasea TaxID=536633 RepID=A0A6N2RS86_9FIRM